MSITRSLGPRISQTVAWLSAAAWLAYFIYQRFVPSPAPIIVVGVIAIATPLAMGGAATRNNDDGRDPGISPLMLLFVVGFPLLLAGMSTNPSRGGGAPAGLAFGVSAATAFACGFALGHTIAWRRARAI